MSEMSVMATKRRAGLYLRVSTDRQELSPVAQRAEGRAYTEFKGLALADADVFEDIGVSGSVPLASRPAGARLMAALDRLDMVIFTKLDRAFRDTVDCILTVDLLRAKGKTVVFLDLGIDTSTAVGQMFMEVSAAFAKFERRRISDRIKECLKSAQEAGKKLGAVPFGYVPGVTIVEGKKVNAGTHLPKESEQAVIDVIGLWWGEGCGCREISRRLNQNNVPTRRTGKWHPEMVRRIVVREMESN